MKGALPTDRHTIEAALDKGQLEVLMAHGRWWRARRNGMTKTWKTRPGEFRIPIKAGLRAYGEVRHDSNPAHFRVAQKG